MMGPTYRNPVSPRSFPDPFVLKFPDGGFSIAPALGRGETGPRLHLQRSAEGGWAFTFEGSGAQFFPCSTNFDPFQDQQLRFRKRSGTVEISWEGQSLGVVEAPAGATRIGLGVRGTARFETVRVTAIPE